MTVTTEPIRVVPTQATVNIIGQFTGWVIDPAFSVERTRVVAALEAQGFDRRLLRDKLKDSDAFIRAVQDIGAALKEPGVDTKVTKFRNACTDAEMIYVIGIHGADPVTGRWVGKESKRFIFDRANSGHDRFQSEDPLLTAVLRRNVNRHLHYVEKKDIVAMILRVLADLKTFNVRSSDGTYFLPGLHTRDADRLGLVLDQARVDAASGLACKLVMWPIADTKSARDLVKEDFALALRQRFTEAQAKWAETVKEKTEGKSIADRTVRSALDKLKEAEADVAFYTEAVSFKGEEILAEIAQFKAKMMEHI